MLVKAHALIEFMKTVQVDIVFHADNHRLAFLSLDFDERFNMLQKSAFKLHIIERYGSPLVTVVVNCHMAA